MCWFGGGVVQRCYTYSVNISWTVLCYVILIAGDAQLFTHLSSGRVCVWHQFSVLCDDLCLHVCVCVFVCGVGVLCVCVVRYVWVSQRVSIRVPVCFVVCVHVYMCVSMCLVSFMSTHSHLKITTGIWYPNLHTVSCVSSNLFGLWVLAHLGSSIFTRVIYMYVYQTPVSSLHMFYVHRLLSVVRHNCYVPCMCLQSGVNV